MTTFQVIKLPFFFPTHFMKKFLLALPLLLATTVSNGQSISVQPYLQDAEPTSIKIMWETTTGTESTVEYGTTAALGSSASGSSTTGLIITQVHTTQLTGLTPDTRYYYKVVTGSAESSIHDFVTPDLQSSERSLKIVAFSDMQQDLGNPNKFEEICNDGVIDYMTDQIDGDIAKNINCVMLPGDLVSTGGNYISWENTFFDPSENLFSHTPVYPVAGNHEGDSPNYFRYFDLPQNGTSGYMEHWYYKDISNVRIIGLETNSGYRIQAQLDWLDGVLADACADADIDFVFAQFHHPHKSELWLSGELGYSGDIIDRVAQFSTDCGKPSIHFYGHTHGYSRGQKQEHQHLMVNVATAGGNIDYWGEYAQNDYNEFLVSQSEYGFVWLEVDAGSDPQFLLKRIGRGDENNSQDNVLRDSIRVKFHNPGPDVPTGVFPGQNDQLAPECIIFLGSQYNHQDGHEHGATQWQIATDAGFSNMVYDEWKNHMNWYYEIDTQAGDDLQDEEVTILQENTTYYWRVRYRDKSLSWSDWSTPVLFSTTGASTTANLLINSGAESNTSNWTEDAGSFESILSGECQGNNAFSGSRLFAVGGVCDPNAYGEGHQDIDVSAYAAEIATGNVEIQYGGYLSDYSGDDRPEFRLDLFDSNSNLITSTNTYGAQTSNWIYFNQSFVAPTDLDMIRMVLMGTRNSGIDNDSYFDEMFVKLNLDPTGCEEYVTVDVPNLTSEDSDLKIYPNPATSMIIVQQENWTGEAFNIRIIDRSGRVVLTETAVNSAAKSVDVNSLSAGVYIVHAFSNEEDLGRKMIVVR